jgi:hypothetical protein
VLCLECFVYIIRVTDQAAPLSHSLMERWAEAWRREATDGAYLDDTTV